jgi:hypothetical protein
MFAVLVLMALAGSAVAEASGVVGAGPMTAAANSDRCTTTIIHSWIDDLARRGAEQREADHSRAVVAHLDWSARNVRLGSHEVVAAYDWDSVGLAAESTAIGQAAATWSVTSEPGGSTFPSATDVAGFLSDYETASGRTLTTLQWRAAAGAVVWLLAYIARCEHSLDLTGRAPDQTGARDRLMRDGDDLLNLRPRHHDG